MVSDHELDKTFETLKCHIKSSAEMSKTMSKLKAIITA